ncbi:uncharacterized protein M6B38_376875 [Iris pallida]|uniref:Uncharacterized protein n=1 Tax=Iris pallida TaxID=29817 RepID=A0AAX6GB18_IRIPA|nr:uncharacterized protein M6B38_376875 [Iris pallida]
MEVAYQLALPANLESVQRLLRHSSFSDPSHNLDNSELKFGFNLSVPEKPVASLVRGKKKIRIRAITYFSYLFVLNLTDADEVSLVLQAISLSSLIMTIFYWVHPLIYCLIRTGA